MGKIRAIKIETEFEKELNRRRKENYDFLVAQSTYEKNKLEMKTIKWILILSMLSNIIQIFK
ncbi:hypothetical protein [Flavobacterium sp. GCM10027622]|uniref:hypothetical protein n=1 Tax=unclassified Flavobacterium TaxID=196869 RepID=UPI00360CB28D